MLEAFTQTALWQQYPGPPAVFEEHWEGTYRAEHTDYVAGATSCDPRWQRDYPAIATETGAPRLRHALSSTAQALATLAADFEQVPSN